MPGKCKGRDQLTLFLIRYVYSCPLAHWHDAQRKEVHKYFRKLRPKTSSYFHVNLKGNKRYYKNWWGRNWVDKSGLSKIWVYEKVQSKGNCLKGRFFSIFKWIRNRISQFRFSWSFLMCWHLFLFLRIWTFWSGCRFRGLKHLIEVQPLDAPWGPWILKGRCKDPKTV